MIGITSAQSWNVVILDPSRLERDCALVELTSAAGVRAEAYDNLRSVPHTHIPDVLLIRLSRAVTNSAAPAISIAEVTQRWPQATAIVIADDKGAMLESLLCGASAVVTSGSSLNTILEVMQVCRSGLYVVPRVLIDVLRSVSSADARSRSSGPGISDGCAGPADPHCIDGLTDRQRKVLELLVLGMANKQIARKLSLSESTIKAHLRGIMDRLGAANRTQIVSRVLGLGLSSSSLDHEGADRIAPNAFGEKDHRDAEVAYIRTTGLSQV